MIASPCGRAGPLPNAVLKSRSNRQSIDMFVSVTSIAWTL